MTRFVYIYFFVKVKTECAQAINFNEFIDTKALIIRDEEVLQNGSKFLKIICSNKYIIKEGDIIKLGKIYLKVLHIKLNQDKKKSKTESNKGDSLNNKSENKLRKTI